MQDTHSVSKGSIMAQFLETLKEGGKTYKELEDLFPGGPNKIHSTISNLRHKGYNIKNEYGKYTYDGEIDYRAAPRAPNGEGKRSHKGKNTVGMEMINTRLVALSRLLQVKIKQNPVFTVDAVSQIDNLIINLLIK